MQFRPCIDLHKGKVKQIVGSTLSDLEKGAKKKLETNFVASKSPTHFAELYASDALYGGHMILLSKDEETQVAARAALRAHPNTLQIGGGVNPRNAPSYLEDGASHVIVTSFVFNKSGELDMGKLEDLRGVVGRERLVLDLSCRRRDDGEYYVVTDRWQKFTSLKVNAESLEALSHYCCEFLIHGVDVEGKRLGIDNALVELLGDLSPIPSTYAGGVCTLEDLDLINDLGKGMVDATVGSALDLFGGDLRYADVIDWHRRSLGGARENGS